MRKWPNVGRSIDLMSTEHGESPDASTEASSSEGRGHLMLQGIKQAFQGLMGRTEPADAPQANDAETDSYQVDVSPSSILEALLFVGNQDNQPLTSAECAELMRGVDASEVDQLVHELNTAYEQEDCPYQIISSGKGYRLQLREEFDRLRDRFYGRIRRARLSQAAIDVLAVVAYHQPVTPQAVEDLRGKPSSSLLSQLVRRELLQVERVDKSSSGRVYRTTDRFLQLFSLDNLAELPRSDEFEKTL